MEDTSIILMVVFGFCGLLLGLIGYHIKKKQTVESISLPGLVLRNVKDKKGLAAFVGNGLQSMGFISLLIGPSIFLLPRIRVFVLLMFVIALIAICLVLVIGIRRFEK